ncbi:hypothetical protein PR048_009272 [Dryococelus australis]|uniref:Transposable element Tc3 transposase n=1 Tax=Dryococelus australis TaxID=614101 RepID=A0ABQ9HZF3_9NEOP|nr:hypothetical protein PR048_009272 [Dryococelus australis]
MQGGSRQMASSVTFEEDVLRHIENNPGKCTHATVERVLNRSRRTLVECLLWHYYVHSVYNESIPWVLLVILDAGSCSMNPHLHHRRSKWRSDNSLDSHSGGPGFDSQSGHPDFDFPWFPEIAPGEYWDGSLTKAMADSAPFLPQSLFPVKLALEFSLLKYSRSRIRRNWTLLIYGDCGRNAKQAVQMYWEMSKTNVLRILLQRKFYPCHVALHQVLYEGNFQQRVQFCRFVLMSIRDESNFLKNILLTDKATFTNHRCVNLRIMHYWATENPLWVRQVEHQQHWKVNVWCGIVGDYVTGPYLSQGTITSCMYARFLRETIPVLLADMPLDICRGMWFQHDGCPSHFALVARQVLTLSYLL